jgi:hypothetical protein
MFFNKNTNNNTLKIMLFLLCFLKCWEYKKSKNNPIRPQKKTKISFPENIEIMAGEESFSGGDFR